MMLPSPTPNLQGHWPELSDGNVSSHSHWDVAGVDPFSELP